MRWMIALILAVLAVAPVFPDAKQQEFDSDDPLPTVTIGAIRLSKPSSSDARIENALSELSRVFVDKGYRVVVNRLTTDKIGESAKNGTVDIFVASGGLYRSLIPYGARDIATLFDPRSGSPNRGIGSSIAVRSDRADLVRIADLKGKTIAVTFPNAFTGNAYAMGEVARLGFDPEAFFGRVNYRSPAGSIIESVISGESDAGVLVTCLLEEMREAGDPRAGMLRVLEPKEDMEFACARTSELYPSWTFATTPHASPEISTIATVALLGLGPDEKGWRWSVATDFSLTDRLLKTLRMGPYQVLRDWTLKGILNRYSSQIILFLLVVCLVLAHSAVLAALVRRRTSELVEALGRERELARESAEVNAKLEAMQRVGTIGQMSSMIAHELKQPLAAIRLMARGLQRRLEDEEIDRESLQDVGLEIHGEAVRAAGIVDRVRGYAKGSAANRRRINMVESARVAVENFRKSGRSAAAVKFEWESPEIWVVSDPLEVELAVINLLKNASEACASSHSPRILVRLATAGSRAVMLVRDNGPRLADEAFEILSKPLSSSKDEGLGLGLVIASSIAEAAGGGLVFERAPDGGDGLTARLTMSLAGKA